MARSLNLPKIYPITDRIISRLSHQEQVKAMIDGGARLIQIRDKTATSRDLFVAARECMNIAAEHGANIIVNDRVDISLMLNADGVHLGQDDLPPEAARKLLGDDAIVGFSAHSIEQVREARNLPIDYIAFGPIFSTGTKKDHDPVVGLDGLKHVRDEIGDFPLVAIGGIGFENLASVFEAGADSAAMISSIVTNPAKIAERTMAAIKIGRLIG